jgi:hypothetical protein
MRNLFIIILFSTALIQPLFGRVILGFGSAATQLVPLVEHLDTAKPKVKLRKMDSAGAAHLRAALDASKSMGVSPKAWYEYISTRNWIMIGVALLMLLAWIFRGLFSK